MEPQEFLKTKDIKVTKGRVEILNILRNSENSLCAEEIYQIYKNNNNTVNINLSTVYRTLELFTDKGIIEKILLSDGICSYKLKKKTHRHHLECDVCHKEIDIPCPMSQIEELLKKETGFTLTEHDLILRGICKDCKQNNKNKKDK